MWVKFDSEDRIKQDIPVLKDIEGNLVGDECQFAYTMLSVTNVAMWVNDENKIVLMSKNSDFENTGDFDIPLPATLVIKNGETNKELFRLSFYVTVSKFDSATSLYARCGDIIISRPQNLSQMDIDFGSAEKTK